MEKKKEKKFGLKGLWAKVKKIKNVEIYITIALGLVIVLIFFSSNPFSMFATNSNDTETQKASTETSAYDYCLRTESKLSQMLSVMKGAGKVEVMINFESSSEIIIAYITSNSGTSGGTSTPQLLQNQGSQIPLILKTIHPKILGVIILAEGAENIKTRVDIQNAVCTLLAIEPNLINVFPMKK